jgi:hypothetical protein
VDDKVFVYLQLRVGETVASRSKIREFAALGPLLPGFLQQAVVDGTRVAAASAEPGAPALEYVDANTDEVLIRFQLDGDRGQQVVEGCIPPAYQARMLDPEVSALSVARFTRAAEESLSPEEQAEVQERLQEQPDLLEAIRLAMDPAGRFRLELPLP